MELITHVGHGALSARTVKARLPWRWSLGAAALGAVFPDSDFVLLLVDPLSFHAYWHRSFTHSLVMLPLWAALPGWLLYWLSRRRQPFLLLWLYACLGVASHIALDLLTAWDIALLWPVGDWRILRRHWICRRESTPGPSPSRRTTGSCWQVPKRVTGRPMCTSVRSLLHWQPCGPIPGSAPPPDPIGPWTHPAGSITPVLQGRRTTETWPGSYGSAIHCGIFGPSPVIPHDTRPMTPRSASGLRTCCMCYRNSVRPLSTVHAGMSRVTGQRRASTE